MVRGGYFPSKTGAGHGIGHLDAILGVGRVVCIKHRDFRETNRNTNYLSAVFIMGCVLECSTEEAIRLGAAIMMQVDWD